MSIRSPTSRIIPDDAIVEDNRGNRMSYFSFCIGVRLGDTIYCNPHIFVDDKQHDVDSHTVCDQCMELRKELKKYQI